MQIGKLRHRIVIEDLTEGRDAQGGIDRSYPTLTTVWGNVRPLRGRELFNAQQVKDQVTHEITIRFQSVVTAVMRLQHRSRTFNILSVVDVDERLRQTTILAEERTA